jgi:hypothetical protein
MKKLKNEILPGAWIVNPKDKGRRKIKKGNVYLQNGDYFEIELYNPLKKSILADIRLNGESISEGGLVLRPGERNYLDCFIDDKRKFKFETYKVDNSDETKEAISDNGLLEVFFYKEDVIQFDNWRNYFRQSVIREYYPIYIERQPYWYYDPLKPNIWYGTNTGYNTNGTITTTNVSYSTNTNSFSSNLSSNLNQIETGRVERGESSNQKFHQVDINFEKNYIHSLIYKILPESQMPKELEKKKSNNETDLLYKLSELKDAGILTEKEFTEKKKEILSRI